MPPLLTERNREEGTVMMFGPKPRFTTCGFFAAALVLGCAESTTRPTEPLTTPTLAVGVTAPTSAPPTTSTNINPSFPYTSTPYTAGPYGSLQIINVSGATGWVAFKQPSGALNGIGPLGGTIAFGNETQIICAFGGPNDMGTCWRPVIAVQGAPINVYWGGGTSNRGPSVRMQLIYDAIRKRIQRSATPTFRIRSNTDGMGVRG